MKTQTSRWIGAGVAALSLAGILFLFSQDHTADRLVLYSLVAALAVGIGLISAERRTAGGRLAASLIGGVLAWLVATLGTALVALVKLGHFDAGGLLGAAFILGLYIGLPTLVFGTFFATVLPMVLRRH